MTFRCVKILLGACVFSVALSFSGLVRAGDAVGTAAPQTPQAPHITQEVQAGEVASVEVGGVPPPADPATTPPLDNAVMKPPSPAVVAVPGTEPYSLDISWPLLPSYPETTGWSVQRRMKGKREWTGIPADVGIQASGTGIGPPSVGFRDTGLLPGVRYEYSVKAYFTGADGTLSYSDPSACAIGVPKGVDSFKSLLSGLEGKPTEFSPWLDGVMAAHPNWTITFVKTGIKLKDLLDIEYYQDSNPKSDLAKFKETDLNIIGERALLGAIKDGNFFMATREGLSYFLDPLGFLNDGKCGYPTPDGPGGIFQFLKLGFEEDVTVEEIIPLLKGTVFAQDSPSYAQWFLEAGKATGISPLALLAKSIIEGGAASGKPSPLLTGYQYGNTTVYNFYGVGAYDGNALANGAKYACDKGWFTPQAAIMGGALKIQTYVARGQDTYYFMRYNIPGIVTGSGVFPQYATNIGDAAVKGRMMSRAAGILSDAKLKFVIPVYEK